MKFLISGCGIGGLSTAHALVNLGHNVQLVERAPRLQPVGAGISLQPNAMQALRQLELDKAIKDVAWQADVAEVRSDRGKLFTRFDFTAYQERFDFLPMTVYRGDLIRVLFEKLMAKKNAPEICLGTVVKSFQQTDDGIQVQCDGGKQFVCDALIAADGIHSSIRQQMWQPQKPRYAGYTCWRGMVEAPELVAKIDTMTEVWGRGARFGFMRCNERQVYWFASEDRVQRSDHESGRGWMKRFKNWMSPVPDLLSATPNAAIVHNDIVDLAPIKRWSKGKVTLLGDAAHAMTPNFGQGGAQAIEDAVVLGMAVSQTNDVELAFRAYEACRIPRTTNLVKGSRQFGRIGQGGNWFFRLVRNWIMPNLPKSFVDRQLAKQVDFDRWFFTEGPFIEPSYDD